MAIIRITLHSDLCAGSGEATGLTVDSDLCMEGTGLPYIPARRIKGCLRQSAMDLKAAGCLADLAPAVEALFGNSTGTEGCLVLGDARLSGAAAMEDWLKASVPEPLRLAAAPLNVGRLFTYVRGQTRLTDGVAETGSLRYTRVMERYNALDDKAETTLEAPVFFRNTDAAAAVDRDQLLKLLEICCLSTRHMGTMRNRGLGNVKVELLDPEDLLKVSAPCSDVTSNGAGEEVVIQYAVRLDQPVTIPGCGEDLTEIPARSVIGCMAGAYLQSGSAEDADFLDLFLNGKVRWSSLTPMVGGVRTTPTPLMLTFLKNDKKYVNQFASGPDDLAGKKQKTLEGTFSAPAEGGFVLTKVDSHTVYHHSTGEDGTLYVQDSLDAGMIFAGTVRIPARLQDRVLALLKCARFFFGRSRSAQYAACSLFGEPHIDLPVNERRPADGAVYVVLESDLLLSGPDGIYETDNRHVRALLASELGLEDELPEGQRDCCQYHTVGGYHSMWQLQRPQTPAVRAGSVYCFRSATGDLPQWYWLGEYPQEGFGLCRIYTEAEMHGLTEISIAPVDIRQPEQTQNEWARKLRTALIVAACREQIRSAVREEFQRYRKDRNWIIRRGIVGRLRLMLAEAESLADLRARVRSIKASDVNSENNTSNAERAMRLIESFYGSNESTPSLAPLLRGDPGLWELVKQDPAAIEQLVGSWWKEPLRMMLHLAYYDNTGGSQG